MIDKSRMVKASLTGILACSLVVSPLLPLNKVGAEANKETVVGFSKAKADWALDFEKRFKEQVSEEFISHYSKSMSIRPALVASKGNKASLEFAVNELKEAGLDPQVATYDVYLSTPKKISITQTAPVTRSLKVIEDLPEDLAFKDEVIMGYNAYSPSGTVEGELVYANYGQPQDFEELEKRGISLKGKIVLVRYGKNFRGVKPDLAAQYGAAGVLIYSDPEDDGYLKGDVYPKGPWRPKDAIQRGSILSIYRYPGDPLTPGAPSIDGVKRIQPDQASSLPKIPTTPISYAEAEGLLKALEGEKAPEEWQGGFPFEYKVGPGGTKVNLSLDIEYSQEPAHDVIVKIPGAKYPEQTIVIGAHRDTWAYGSKDNTSGWSTTMEIARALGKLHKEGWRPDRTIVLAGWDGEEYGLIGSTEWAEEHKKELTENAVAYINLDSVAGQNFGASSVPSLNELIYSITKTTENPETKTTVFEDWSKKSGSEKPAIGQLGSGSDYTAFIQHIGVPSADLGFSSPDGLYHSAYDNTYSLETFVDPGYKQHAAVAKLAGSMALRLANADVLPIKYSDYASAIKSLTNEVEKHGTLGVDLAGVKKQLDEWEAASKELEEYGAKLTSKTELSKDELQQLRKINEALMQQERDLTNQKGLPSREWFKHQIWAPGLTTGYAAQPLPALVEAQQTNDEQKFKEAVKALEKSLEQATKTAKAAIK
ncbi:M28 family metallopeptidase [Aneurinibacillus migulanus]|uniref:M28 family metallopeptidase n=1 Tax=Aneurinibacillus migulanus TaxID=47500 RepID=UPI0005C2A569|nr:M28 family metallopeptidase [Aneurinibacillus migulanus]KIV57097.1 aminopeptidase [Aneurinibacillus migulanus]